MIKLFEVGGCLRDELLGLPSKDIDFVCEAPGFEAMKLHLEEMGLKIFLSKPEFATIRCGIPEGHPLRSRCKDADFVLARRDGPTADGRRPEYVEPGTLADDLARRDFTINALARCPLSGDIIDHHNGREDLSKRVLRFVGDPIKRIEEDGLRVLRGFRFSITKKLVIEPLTDAALRSATSTRMLACVSIERVREELEKMFAYDTLGSLQLLGSLSKDLQLAIFRDNLRLSATLKKN